MLLIDKYAYFNKLSHTHPVEKICFSMVLLLFSLIVKDIFVSLITFMVMSAFTIFAAKIPFTYYIKLLLLPAAFLLSSIITIIISITHIENITIQPIWQLQLGQWLIYISSESIEKATILFFTVLGSISCLYFLTLTTPLTTIFDILRKLKVPQLLIELIELTYRFIFVFLDTSLEIFKAQHARLGYFSMKQSIKSLGLLVSTLFIHVFRRANQLTIAMNARCYNEELSFLQTNYKYSAINWIMMIIIFAVIVFVYVMFGGSLK